MTVSRDLEYLLSICKSRGIPTDGWFTASVRANPIQIYDRSGFKALINRNNGSIRIYDRSQSAIEPVVMV
ncbi:MAG: hypothetical protein RBR26_05505 [Methanosarcina mazei]|nr:hypothetical protein [Methanosarcina mazei]